jgi:hypothetical protein
MVERWRPQNDQHEGVGHGRLWVTTACAGGGPGVTTLSWRLPHEDLAGWATRPHRSIMKCPRLDVKSSV